MAHSIRHAYKPTIRWTLCATQFACHLHRSFHMPRDFLDLYIENHVAAVRTAKRLYARLTGAEPDPNLLERIEEEAKTALPEWIQTRGRRDWNSRPYEDYPWLLSLPMDHNTLLMSGTLYYQFLEHIRCVVQSPEYAPLTHVGRPRRGTPHWVAAVFSSKAREYKLKLSRPCGTIVQYQWYTAAREVFKQQPDLRLLVDHLFPTSLPGITDTP